MNLEDCLVFVTWDQGQAVIHIWGLFSDKDTQSCPSPSVPLLLRDDILAGQNGNEHTMSGHSCEKLRRWYWSDEKAAVTAHYFHVCLWMNHAALTQTLRLALEAIFIWRLQVAHIMFDRILASKHRLMDKRNNYLSFMCLTFLFLLLLLRLNMFLLTLFFFSHPTLRNNFEVTLSNQK